MNIKICTDSTCDLSREQIESNNITVSPLYVIKEGETFRDGVDLQAPDVVQHVLDGGNLCSTSAVNMGDYEDLFAEFSPKYDAVIEITLGSDFSSCYQNARNAAEAYSNVYVVDSKNLSTGEGLVVMEAVRLAKSGMDAEAIVKELEAVRDKVEASFIMERLDFMKKGGRCSTLALLGANILKIKPCIKVKNGKMGLAEKYRGSYSKCLEDYVKERLDGRDDIRTDLIFITCSPTEEKYVDQAEELIKKYKQFDNIVRTNAGCTVSCHCGPNTLGVLFIAK